MVEKPFHVLFICRQNSARSQMAQVLLSQLGRRRFVAYSAGTEPAAEVHPLTLETIRNAGLRADDLSPKGLELFTGPDAPALDFAFTVCDDGTVPALPLAGSPLIAEWPFPDPTVVPGSHAEQSAAFADTFRMIRRRVELFVELPVERLDRLALQAHVDHIGRAG